MCKNLIKLLLLLSMLVALPSRAKDAAHYYVSSCICWHATTDTLCR